MARGANLFTKEEKGPIGDGIYSFSRRYNVYTDSAKNVLEEIWPGSSGMLTCANGETEALGNPSLQKLRDSIQDVLKPLKPLKPLAGMSGETYDLGEQKALCRFAAMGLRHGKSKVCPYKTGA